MAKELPFFKFNATQWLTGNIHYEEWDIKGVFADLCAEYWNRDCELTLDDAFKRIKNDKILNFLQQKNYFKLKKNKISISFLDEQFFELNEKHSKLSAAGRKGGLSKAKATLKRGSSIKDKEVDIDKEREVDNVLLKKEPKEDSVYFENDFLLNEKYKEFLKFRKQIKSPIVETSISANKKRLMNISGNESDLAIEIIEQSIANGWKGFFELKTVENNKQNGNNNDNKWFSRKIS